MNNTTDLETLVALYEKIGVKFKLEKHEEPELGVLWFSEAIIYTLEIEVGEPTIEVSDILINGDTGASTIYYFDANRNLLGQDIFESPDNVDCNFYDF